MPIIYQKRIYRDDLQANTNILYLFGDNDQRDGYGGQAGEMRDEENAVGVRTKWFPSNEDDAFFSDADFDSVSGMLVADLERVREHLEDDGIVVIPLDGLGTGLSQLPERAPRIAAYLESLLEELKGI